MQSLFSTFFSWAGPNAIGAMAAATVVWFLMSIGKPRHVQHLIVTIGAAVIAVLAVSALAALAGLEPMIPGGLGAVAGVVAGMLLRARA